MNLAVSLMPCRINAKSVQPTLIQTGIYPRYPDLLADAPEGRTAVAERKAPLVFLE